MITIGIDPGIERTGIGIVRLEKQRYILIYKQLIKTSSKTAHAERLFQLHTELTDILKQYKIEHASVEKLFFARNVTTAMKVSEARGVILLALQQQQIEVFEYTPLQVKQALTGYGRADKQQIQSMIKKIMGLDEVPRPDDVADGIALAITHINTFKTLARQGRVSDSRKKR